MGLYFHRLVVNRMNMGVPMDAGYYEHTILDYATKLDERDPSSVDPMFAGLLTAFAGCVDALKSTDPASGLTPVEVRTVPIPSDPPYPDAA